MSRPAGLAARPSAVSTTTAATSRFRRGRPSSRLPITGVGRPGRRELQRLYDRCHGKDAWGCPGPHVCGRWRELPDHTEDDGRKCVRALRDRDDERDHARHVISDEFNLGNQRRQPRSVAKSDAEQNDSKKQQGGVRAIRGDERNAARHLYGIAGRKPSVSCRLSRA